MVTKKLFMLVNTLTILAVGCGSASEVKEGIKEEPAQAATSTAIPMPTAIPEKTTSFKVGAGEEAELPLSIPEGTVIEYSFTVDNEINFKVLHPRGNSLISKSRVLADQGNFLADEFGRYTLVFDNGFSTLASTTVTMVYRVVTPGAR